MSALISNDAMRIIVDVLVAPLSKMYVFPAACLSGRKSAKATGIIHCAITELILSCHTDCD